MPTLLDNTYMGAQANTYVLSADVDLYQQGRKYADSWVTTSAPDKEAFILMAARMLELEHWKGTKFSVGQAMRWPRVGCLDLDGLLVDSATIPLWLKNAQSELAIQYCLDDRLSDQGTMPLDKASLPGGLSVEYSKSVRYRPIPEVVLAMIQPYVHAPGRLVRT